MPLVRTTTLAVALIASFVGAANPRADDSRLSSVQSLYEAASYREVLDALTRFEAGGDMPAAAYEYRALCFIALDQPRDAVLAFEALLDRDPFYVIAPEHLSPRVEQLFDETRRRVLPVAAQTRFERAKAAFDHDAWADAADGFRVVSRIVDTTREAGAFTRSLHDLQMLADGYAQWAAARGGFASTAFLGGDDGSRITAPVLLEQTIPRWPTWLGRPPRGQATIDLLVDDTGRVIEAQIRQSLHPVYDALLLDATQRWRYAPATRNGRPTAFAGTLRVQAPR
jgi:TonB family protein